jgi:hypothetical protein
MKKVSELKPGDKVRHGDLVLTVKAIWNEDGQTKILFYDIPLIEEKRSAFRDLVEKTGGMGILAPVSVKGSGYKESPLREVLIDNLKEEEDHGREEV